MHCPLRNRASLAHANELLDEPEATVALNAVYTIFRYIQDCIKRFGNA
ncbi:abortive infection family protein [Halomonas sp. TA22]